MIDNFHQFSEAVTKQFDYMSQSELYVVDVEDLFDTYLSAFPGNTNPIFRERTEHDCSCCKQFIRNIGNVVAIINNELVTVWDTSEELPPHYKVVTSTLASIVKQSPIKGVFRTTERQYGAKSTVELSDDKTTHHWDHFVGRPVERHRTTSLGTVISEINSAAQVFRRGLDEFNTMSFETVLELITENALYRGEEFKEQVKAFRDLHCEYPRDGSELDKTLFVWSNINNRAARFRNSVIGTLIQDISDGVDLEHAVKSFEQKVAPTNYKRPTALITKRMIDNALETLRDLGLESATERRFAKLSDVSVNNVLFVDNSVQEHMKDGLEGLLLEEVKPAKIDIKNAEKITGEEFFSRIVPQASSINLLLENKHSSNFMSLTAPVNGDVQPLFKWDNNFGWSYDGDVTDSIKQRVKSAGGNIEADLRVSLAWFNFDDLDIHCNTPDGKHIYFSNKAGILDVDMNACSGNTREAVENLAFIRPKDGIYRISVNNYSRRESVDVGFVLEVEDGGGVRTFTSAKSPAGSNTFECLSIHVKNGIISKIEATASVIESSVSRNKWGVSTETLMPVDTLMLSPNHWDGQSIGNKHWFFLLKGCKNPDSTRGIYNEFLRSSLEKHRKVFEVLGAKTKCQLTDDQLSGVGFSSTRGDRAIVVAKGSKINQAFNIQF